MSASPAPVYDWNALDAAGRDAVLARPVQAVAQRTRDAVAGLLADVQARGDVALREVTARFDGVQLETFEVGEQEFAAAHAAVPVELREAMQQADCSDTSGLCSGNCAGCDVEHEQK